ncbi:Uncharacterised protein [Serratia fonticola]|uniref:Uncharacterized protein n=1 Tax=Serratia fonticola TaxID=47917 RepID=A0A3S4X4I3_SERFO|nr:Uncharacterised protein [Serratia fonticola]
MLRKHSLAAFCCTTLLLSAPTQALDLSYKAPEPSIKAAPAPKLYLGPRKKPPRRQWSGQNQKIRPASVLILNATIPAAAAHATNRIRRLIAL